MYVARKSLLNSVGLRAYSLSAKRYLASGDNFAFHDTHLAHFAFLRVTICHRAIEVIDLLAR